MSWICPEQVFLKSLSLLQTRAPHNFVFSLSLCSTFRSRIFSTHLIFKIFLQHHISNASVFLISVIFQISLSNKSPHIHFQYPFPDIDLYICYQEINFSLRKLFLLLTIQHFHPIYFFHTLLITFLNNINPYFLNLINFSCFKLYVRLTLKSKGTFASHHHFLLCVNLHITENYDMIP